MQTSTVPDKEELRALIADVLDVPVADLVDDAHFINDLGADSLLSLELMVTLEATYGVRISEEEFRTMENFRSAYDQLITKFQDV